MGCCAVVYDMNGREAKDVEPVLAAVGDIEQYIFCSSAGVYLKSDQMPHREEDSTDPKSRHKASFYLGTGSIAFADYCCEACSDMLLWLLPVKVRKA